MNGVWYSANISCGAVMVINADGAGKLISHKGHFCNSGESIASGKVQYKNNIIYINKWELEVIEKPSPLMNDSIWAPNEGDLNKDTLIHQKSFAKIILRMKNGWGNNEDFQFYKYVNY